MTMEIPKPNPTFTTRRLAVFRQDIVISQMLCARRAVFTAFNKHEDDPRIICTMLVTTDIAGLGAPYLDWITTDTDYRRKGYAEELWRAVNVHLKVDILADGASEAGDALCEKMESNSE